jgi:PBP1b-binding outer membrane lipoprotein LpoB
MKIKNLILGLLVAAAMASCDKKPTQADNATSPGPTVKVKTSGTVNPAVEAVPNAPVDSSATPPK